jgi:hypothetical protein
VKEGDLVNREVLSDALKDLFARHKLSKTVRSASPTSASSSAPAAAPDDDASWKRRSVGPRRIPMPLDQAVLDHQVVARRDGPDGKPMDARGGSPP